MGIWAEFRKFRKLWKRREQDLSQFAIGVNSTVSIQEYLHAVFLDYDIQDMDKIRESVKEVQRFWNLTDAYLYRTTNGYHAIIWHSHVPYGRLKQIVEFAAYVDPMYKAISNQYWHKTLRVAGKYAKQDIVFERIMPGVRKPSEDEWSRGEMKRKEHAQLLQISKIEIK
jgi:hypothetical protein